MTRILRGLAAVMLVAFVAAGAGSLARQGISITPAIAQEILSNPGAFYFNIHSSLNPNGVLRGQLVRD